jgi:drug/metabolite transporter (DMT)-like permease
MSTPPTPNASFISPGIRAMLWSALAFSVMSAMVKLAGSRIPSAEIAIFRGAITLVLSGVALYRAKLSPWGKDTRWLLVRGLLGCLGLHCYYFALTQLPLAEATVIQFLNPVLVAAMAPFALGERPGPRDVVGTLLGFAGVLLIARPGTLFGTDETAATLSTTGVAVGLLGAFVSALVYLVVRKLKDEDARVVVFQLPLLVIPLTLPLAIPIWVWPTPLEWLVLLAVGVATQIGQVKMTEGIQRETAARATAVSFVQVAFAMLFSVFLFREVPTIATWIGGALVFGGTLLVARGGNAAPR